MGLGAGSRGSRVVQIHGSGEVGCWAAGLSMWAEAKVGLEQVSGLGAGWANPFEAC